VAVVQYTFTHKQYREDTKQTIHRTTQKFGKSAGRAPSLQVVPWHLPYNLKKTRKNLSFENFKPQAEVFFLKI